MEGFGIYLNYDEMTKRHGEWREGTRIKWLSSPEVITESSSPIKPSAYVKV
jgi:hypothetical protein